MYISSTRETERSVAIKKSQHKTEIVAVMKNGIKKYGSGDTAIYALNGVSIDIEKGRFVAIMGPSGSGKSTLLHCMSGLDSLTSGDVKIAGKSLVSLKDKKLTLLRRKNVGFIFQSFNLVSTLSAEENIKLPLLISNSKTDQKWYEKVIGTLDIKNRLSHMPSELSGGQRQRVAVARALVSKPKIIFADEPSGNLDSKSSTELLSFLRSMVDDLGQTLIMVTHDPRAASFADEVVFLKDGSIVDKLLKPTQQKIFKYLQKLEY